ncbi:ArsR/SmtB family transcription factor [Bacillus salitolerans]|uniref:ArsR/SmtB family transcription factor n=1 Tax=Bacillus salitolerans TaxID=1437434 RepID=A0ABW4LPV8_9BACI
MDNQEEILRLLDAVSDPIRTQLIFLIGQHGRMNVTDITAHFALSRPAISHHLKVLKDAGALSSNKKGQEVFYELNRRQVVTALRTLADSIEGCCPYTD